MPCFTPKKLLSQQNREYCLKNLTKVPIPRFSSKVPNATAAVLIPLCIVNGTVALLYTVRSIHLRSHSGQISFPGGKADENEKPADTALRETEEEIGIRRDKIDIWGTGPAIPGRNNKIMITPVLGTMVLKEDSLNLNKEEVQSVVLVPLKSLCDTRNQFHTQFSNGVVLPVFLYEQHRIWGITAYITHTILSCLFPKDVYHNNWMSKKIENVSKNK